MSMVLFLTNCSLTKAAGGASAYAEDESIAALLPAKKLQELLERRRAVYQLVKNEPDFTWQGRPVLSLEYNRDLTLGADFGHKHNAQYLPAIDRYEGRFFQALGANGKQRLRASPHHVLFLSGLYGLLRSLEPVQRYSCPLEPMVADVWQGPLLSDALCAYIERFGIARIIDLTAIDSYRALIDWQRIGGTNTDVLHGFDVMAEGDYALTSLGKCLGTDLLGRSEDELIGLESESRIDTVLFRSLGAAPFRQRFEQQPPLGRNRKGTALSTDDAPAPATWSHRLEERFVNDIWQHTSLFTRIMQATVHICRDPKARRGDTVKPLKGDRGVWRYRVGSYRLIYRVDSAKGIVWFMGFGPRGEIYRRFG